MHLVSICCKAVGYLIRSASSILPKELDLKKVWLVISRETIPQYTLIPTSEVAFCCSLKKVIIVDDMIVVD